MMRQQDRPFIIVFGGINMDLVTLAPRFPQAGETVTGSRFITYPGGKGANQAVAAARMGAQVNMVGRIGDDVFGPQALTTLYDVGVDVSGVRATSGVHTGIAAITIDEMSQNSIVQVLGANDTCGPDELSRIMRLLPRAAAVLLQLEVSIDLSLQVAQAAAAQGVKVILDPSPGRPLPDEIYPCCDIITPNETDARALGHLAVTDRATAAMAAGSFLAKGVGAVVIKLGSNGVYYATPQGSQYQEAIPVEAVDSVGAGDAFNGALAVALLERQNLEQAVKIASAAGALAVTRFGAQDSMPTRTEVDDLLAEHGYHLPWD